MKVIIRSDPASASQYVARYIIREFSPLSEHNPQLITVVRTDQITCPNVPKTLCPRPSNRKQSKIGVQNPHRRTQSRKHLFPKRNNVQHGPPIRHQNQRSPKKFLTKPPPPQDEYVDLPTHHPESYHSFMFTHLFSHIDIPRQNVHILNGNAPDLEAECAAYEARIKAVGGIDLFLGGVGTDGHIAFNEPGSSLVSRTRVKTLADETVRANARFFGGEMGDVPRMALTVGVGTIVEVCANIHSSSLVLPGRLSWLTWFMCADNITLQRPEKSSSSPREPTKPSRCKTPSKEESATCALSRACSSTRDRPLSSMRRLRWS